MAKIDWLLLILLGVFIFVAGYLAWENRASEKIITAMLQAGVGAVAAIILSVFFIAKQPTITETFPAAFYCVSETKLPWVAPWGTGDRWIVESYWAPAKLKEANPSAFSGTTDADTILLYHYLLQWSILNWIAEAYGANWKAQFTHFDLPDSREGSIRSTLTDLHEDRTQVTPEEVQKALEGNPFSKVQVFLPPQFVLPPDTKMSVTVPTKNGVAGEIVLRNDFITLQIQTTAASYKNSIGTYAKLAGLSDEQDRRLMKVGYVIKITIDFNRWKSGNPRMSEYQAWAEQIKTELRDSFDEQLIWARIKDNYLLQRQIELFGPIK